MTLVEFLLARIAEDKERSVHEFDCNRFEVYNYGTQRGDCDCGATSQLLAECDAKRQIIENTPDGDNVESHAGQREMYRATLEYLALPYADHPDYAALNVSA